MSNDLQVITRVMIALLENAAINRARLEVACERGIVTLGGEVLSETARLAAEDITRHQVHVLDVVNRLQVVAGQTAQHLFTGQA